MVLEDLRRPLRERLGQIPGLLAMTLSDLDGVIVLKVSKTDDKLATRVENIFGRYIIILSLCKFGLHNSFHCFLSAPPFSRLTEPRSKTPSDWVWVGTG